MNTSPEYIKKLITLVGELHEKAHMTLVNDKEVDLENDEMNLLSDIGYLAGFIQALETELPKEDKNK